VARCCFLGHRLWHRFLRLIFDTGCDHPSVDSEFDPDRDSDRPDASAFALKVGQHPPALPLLDGLDVELGQLVLFPEF
jgi:hypothetical protein